MAQYSVMQRNASVSSPGTMYEIRFTPATSAKETERLYCTCPGWRFNRKCRHLTSYVGGVAAKNRTQQVSVVRPRDPKPSQKTPARDAVKKVFRDMRREYGYKARMDVEQPSTYVVENGPNAVAFTPSAVRKSQVRVQFRGWGYQLRRVADRYGVRLSSMNLHSRRVTQTVWLSV
jgi:hypothetical protein